MHLVLGLAEGEVVLESGEGTLVRDGEWLYFSGTGVIPEGEGNTVLVVTNAEAMPLAVSYEVRVAADPEDTGTPPEDTGDGADTGEPDIAGDPAVDGETNRADKQARSGCSVSPVRAVWGWPLVLLGLRRRCG